MRGGRRLMNAITVRVKGGSSLMKKKKKKNIAL